MLNLKQNKIKMATTKSFVLYNGFRVMPVRRATGKVVGGVFTRQNIESVISTIGAATGVAGYLENAREKARKDREAKEASTFKGDEEGFKPSVDTSNKDQH